MTLNKETKTLFFLAFTIAIAGFVYTTSLPYADAHYHKGWTWDTTNHANEFHGNKVPMAFRAELNNTLVLAPGTNINDVYIQLENAVNQWDTSTNFSVKRYDTTTSIYDNYVGTADLSSTTLGSTYTMRHGYFLDNHVVKTTIDLNYDDIIWDHNGDNDVDNTTLPLKKDTIRVYNTMLHEMGHVAGLCDTYNPNANLGDCHGHSQTNTVMNSYVFGGIRTITSNDITQVNNHY